MPALMTMVAWDGDSIGRSAGNARLSNDVTELRRVSHAIERGNQAFSGWALAAGGSVIETGGDEGLIEIPAEALDQLDALRQNYKDLVGATVSVGVGKSPAEASQALLVAKLRGKDRVVFFAPEIPKEIEKLQDQTPEDKLRSEYLQKADDEGSADKKSARGVSPPSRQRGESSEGEVAQGALQDQAAAAAPLASSLPGGPALAGFHAAAAGQDQQDRAAAVRRSSDIQALKQRLAATLQQLKTQLPVLQQIKQTFPDTYQAVTALARGVVDLARGLQDQDAQLAKAERAPRVWKERTGGFPGGISIPGAGHPQREAYDAAYRSAAAARYARGDVAGLGDVQDIDLSQITPGNSGKGVVNQSRYDLYHRMATAGEKLPPAIARRTASGFELLDGTHRYEASKAAGGAKLQAYIVKSWGEGSMSDVQPHEPMLAQGTDLMREAMNEVEFDASSKWPPGMGMAASEMGETEASPEETFPEGKDLDKSAKFQAERPFDVARSGDPAYLKEWAKPWAERVSMVTPHNADDFDWQYDPGLTTSALGTGYRGYLDEERREARKEGRRGDPFSYTHHWLQNPAQQPVVVVHHDNKVLPVDGSHRLGAAEERGVTKLPAVVGRLKKGAVPSDKPPRIDLPVGTLMNGKIKTSHGPEKGGKTSWRGVRAGMIASQDAGGVGGGATTHAVSSREPNSP